MNRSFVISLFSLLFLGTTPPEKTNPAPESLIRQMIAETRDINTLAYTMRKFERIGGKMTEQVAEIRFNRSPFKVYARQRYPNDGLEILYSEGENRGRVLVNPNGFPWINVSLDPHCHQIRKDQHHSVFDTGYDLVLDILEHLVNKYRMKTDDILKLISIDLVNGKSCWVLSLDNPNFGYRSYTVQQGETLISIANKFRLSEHMILEKNEEIDGYHDIEAGQTIQIPNDYCPKMILTIEQDRMIPVIMKIYDEKGLYELYEFKDVVVNPVFKKEEFTPDFEDYGF
jgi:hypothetical protein